jgi:hypothetical protein
MAHGTWHMAHDKAFLQENVTLYTNVLSEWSKERLKSNFGAKQTSFESFYNVNCNFQWFLPRTFATM